MNFIGDGGHSFGETGLHAETHDADLSEVDREEKQRLIKQVMEFQHTLVDLSKRVDAVKEENVSLRTENQILGQYIEKLMATSSIFQSSSPPSHGAHSASSIGAPLLDDDINDPTTAFHYDEGSELTSEDDIA